MNQQPSYGQQLTRRYLNRITQDDYIENYRPDWLFGMELDFYFPEKRLAIEFNGDQHVCFTEMAGSHEKQAWRDRRKMILCQARGVKFITFEAVDLLYGKIRRTLKPHMKLRGGSHARDIDRDASLYRKTLISKWNSPTARKKRHGPRKQALLAAEIKAMQNGK